MKINILQLVIYCALCMVPSTLQSQMSVGSNISWVTYFSTEWTFTDAFRMSDSWITRNINNQGWDAGKSAEIPQDTNGYPLQIPFTAPSDGQQYFVHTVIPVFAQGNYTLVTKGKGKILMRNPASQHYWFTLTGGTSVNTIPMSDPIPPRQLGWNYPIFLLEVRESDPSDPIREIRLIQPGFYDATTQQETEIFHPLFKQRLLQYSTLRFMDFGYTNGSPLQEFSQRTLPTSQTQFSPKGSALEYMADLSNETQKNMWICIPHQASDDYVLQVAQLLKARVRTGLKIYVEYSNETWNTLFSQTTYVQDKGLALNRSSDRYIAGHLYIAQRSGEIFKIFQDAFGANDRNRLVFVVGTQHGNTWNTEMVLNALANPMLNPGGVRADALASAPYIAMIYPPSSVCNGNCIPSVDELIAEAQSRIITEITPTVRAMKRVADKFHLGYVNYEGGQHLVGLYEAINYQSLTDSLNTANKDPRMYEVYKNYLDTLNANGVQLLEHFASCGSWGKYGSWGALEYQDQPESVAHKYRALKDWGNNHPFTADNAPPSVPMDFQIVKIYDASIRLKWKPSTDNVGIQAYVVSVDGKVVGLTPDTTFLVSNLNPNTAYTLNIQAKDKSMNYSLSASTTATTLHAPTGMVVCDFTGTTPAASVAWMQTSVLSPDVTYSGIVRGSGIVPATDLNDAYGFSISGPSNGARSTLAEAMTENEYLSFKIAPIPNKALNWNDAKFQLKIKRLSGASPQTYSIFNSHTGFEAGKELFSYQYTSDFDETENNIIFYLPENGYKWLADTLEFRIYTYNGQYDRHRTSITGLSIHTFFDLAPFSLGNLSVSNLQYNSLKLDWSAIQNLVNFQGYDIYVNGEKHNSSLIQTTHYTVTGLTSNMPYVLVVKARDAQGNILYQTQKRYATTPSPFVSYNLLNFNGLDAMATLFVQRSFTTENTTNTMPFHPNTSFFNTSLKAHQMSGGVQVDYAPLTATAFSGNFSLNIYNLGYLPGHFIVQVNHSIHPTRLTVIPIWTKDKFAHATSNDWVQFDNNNNSILKVKTTGMSPQTRSLRFVIRNGNTYYMSEMLINQTGAYELAAFGDNSAVGKRWGIFDPTTLKMPNPLPTFEAVSFQDVREIGFLYEGLRSGYGDAFTFTDFSVNGLVIPQTVLPLIMEKWEGKAEKHANHLFWRTKQENQVAHFDVERSLNGLQFETIGQLKAQNQGSDYDYWDKMFLPIVYYRLKINDLSGKFEYSNLISIQSLHTSMVKIQPNFVKTVLTLEGSTDYGIFNMAGQCLLQSMENRLNVESLPAGMYLVRGRNAQGGLFLSKFVKE